MAHAKKVNNDLANPFPKMKTNIKNVPPILRLSRSVTRLGGLLDFGQQLFCPNRPHFYAIFAEVSINFHFSGSEIIFEQLL